MTDNSTSPVEEPTSDGVGRLTMFTIDCDDADIMARFWSAMLDGAITYNEGDYSSVSVGEATLGFGRTADFVPPAWPDDGHKQFHLDITASDLDGAVDRAVALGASRPAAQPADAAGRWVVMLDPAGHPFCLVAGE